ncbi:beta-galactosidase [Verrucomicrobium sp. GAS474]|uniref:beta-galactosidase GalA n=1 Tax=Verrucomicrobium sp. GAS474 TaxID=1882831 RepID=UPI00087C0558|nr:beta-galactosidase GalA [Verrucomicrobium sp. GAS474]SDU10915.1 beta-galactosidase [Verrucomicrobium sp. GAS474]
MRFLLLPFLFLLPAGPLFPAPAAEEPPPARERLLLDTGWKFTFGDPPDDNASALLAYPEARVLSKNSPADREAERQLVSDRSDPVSGNLGGKLSWVAPGFNDGAWRDVTLPHDWAVSLPYTSRDDSREPETADKDHGRKAIAFPNAAARAGTNVGWYRRTFTLPESDKGRAVWVEFDGIYRNSLVWINGHCVGRNPSGTIGTHYNLTPWLRYGIEPDQANTIVVRADATRAEGWYYEGAGIYRHAWLVKAGSLHVAHWGTFVSATVKQGGGSALLRIETTLRNDGTAPASATLLSAIFAPSPADKQADKQVAEAAPEDVSLQPGEEKTVVSTVPVVEPVLWSLDNPALYRLVSRVQGLGNQPAQADAYETPFGIRTLAFDPEKGFFLNGQHVEIQGTANHQDHAGVGTALPDRLQAWRIEQLKEIGSNAYRTAHHPSAPELLDACDRLGMLVLDENRRFDDSATATDELERMIRRDRNHPSVFLWSLGNEEWHLQGDEAVGTRIFVTLRDLAHRLDPSRLTTFGNNGARALPRGGWDRNTAWGIGFSVLTDVMGFNYCNLFNTGPTPETTRPKDPDVYHRAFPRIPSLGTEEASTLTTRGAYAPENPAEAATYALPEAVNRKSPSREKWAERYLPAYDAKYPNWGSTAEAWWKYYLARPWLAGGFVWTGFDYRGEPMPFESNTGSQFGILDACGFPKDIAYYYQAWWSRKSVLHLLPHWNWPGREGQPIPVWVYANCEEVELFLNGKSLGKKSVPQNGHLEWSVPYAPGVLSARGSYARIPLSEARVETTGTPYALRLVPDRPEIAADGEDAAIVRAEVVDKEGRVVPTAGNLLSFEISGGRLLGVGNGNPASREAEQEPTDKAAQRSAFNGLAQLIVGALRQPGPVVVKATAEGLAPATLTLTGKPSTPRPFVP